jgi:hypothetical protein
MITKLDALSVQEEHPAGYAASHFGFWRDDDADGCNTGHEVLVQQAAEVSVKSPGCRVVSGKWNSPYDGIIVNDPADIAVDYLVSLQETWESGAWQWTDQKRNDYLNDLKQARLMLAVSATSRQDKNQRDPTDWLPPNQNFRCDYLKSWIDVKTAWKLSVDASERESIAAASLNC